MINRGTLEQPDTGSPVVPLRERDSGHLIGEGRLCREGK